MTHTRVCVWGGGGILSDSFFTARPAFQLFTELARVLNSDVWLLVIWPVPRKNCCRPRLGAFRR